MTAHLAGDVYASRLVIAVGSNVTIDAGASICVSDEFIVDETPTFVDPPDGPVAKSRGKRARANAPRGADGTNYGAQLVEVGNRFVLNAPLLGREGGDGEDVIVGALKAARVGGAGRAAIGGNGGDGLSFVIRTANGILVLNANITPGRGGDGGDALVSGGSAAAGQAGETVFASGGHGGNAGNVILAAANVVVPNDGGRVQLRRGGRGGKAEATASSGASPDAGLCRHKAPGGGNVRAEGGDAGCASQVLGAATVSSSRNQIAVTTIKDIAVVHPDDVEVFLALGGETVATSDNILKSRGGDATATAGHGASAASCATGGETTACPKRGPRPRPGGDGGETFARGGRGGDGPLVAIVGNVLRTQGLDALDTLPGGGGSATAIGGNGGRGGDAHAARKPQAGGRGGFGGGAVAFGGDAGTSPFVKGLPLNGAQISSAVGSTQLFPPPTAELLDLNTSALRGAARASGGAAGDGGNGGDCCGRPGGRGAVGGKAGKPGGPLRAAVGRLQTVVDPRGRSKFSGTTSAGLPGKPGTNGDECGPGGPTPVQVGFRVDTPDGEFVAGETAAVFIDLTNRGAQDILGAQLAICVGGEEVLKAPAPIDLPAGQTVPIVIPLKLAQVGTAQKLEIKVDGSAVLEANVDVKASSCLQIFDPLAGAPGIVTSVGIVPQGSQGPTPETFHVGTTYVLSVSVFNDTQIFPQVPDNPSFTGDIQLFVGDVLVGTGRVENVGKVRNVEWNSGAPTFKPNGEGAFCVSVKVQATGSNEFVLNHQFRLPVQP